MQGTKGTGKRAREFGEGFEIIYIGQKSSRNGMGIILSQEFKKKVVEVSSTFR